MGQEASALVEQSGQRFISARVLRIICVQQRVQSGGVD